MIKLSIKEKIVFILIAVFFLFYGTAMTLGLVPKNWTELRYGWYEYSVKCEMTTKTNGVDTIYQLDFYRPFYGSFEKDFHMKYNNKQKAIDKLNQFVEWKKEKDIEKNKNTYKVIETIK